MKKYNAPEMESLSFAAMEAISFDDLTSKNSNDIEFSYGGNSGQVNG